MSMPRIIEVTCPNPQCNKKSKTTIWQSLNAELNPKEKEQLLNGTLFHFECPYCNKKTNLNYGMLYHNMTQKVMVHYAISDENAVEIQNSIQEIQTKKDAILNLDGYKIRIVKTQNALREKAIIFDNDLDDRIIEIMKLFNTAQAIEQYPDLKIVETLFCIDENGDFCIEFIANYPLSAKLNKNIYDTIKTEMKHLFQEETDSFEINEAWAKNILLK